MQIDAHHHLWAAARGDYDWMPHPDSSSLRRDATPADLASLLQQHRIDRTVVVQAAPTVFETEYLAVKLAGGGKIVDRHREVETRDGGVQNAHVAMLRTTPSCGLCA